MNSRYRSVLTALAAVASLSLQLPAFADPPGNMGRGQAAGHADTRYVGTAGRGVVAYNGNPTRYARYPAYPVHPYPGHPYYPYYPVHAYYPYYPYYPHVVYPVYPVYPAYPYYTYYGYP